jgi:outer membrane immunogenic protein
MRGYAVAALMSSILAVSPALAADLPASPPPPPPRAPATYVPIAPPPFSWTGIYVGANGGWGWSKVDDTDAGPGLFGSVFPIGTTTSFSQNGWLAGGQIGFNYQINALVLGAEADFDASGIKNTVTIPGTVLSSNSTYKNDWMSTFAARFGVAADRALFYGKAGGAWTRDNFNITATDGSSATGIFDRWGWMLGAGIEIALTDNITFKTEYNYLNFGTNTQTLTFNTVDLVTRTITADPNQNKLTINVVKAGINVLFH